jgi:acetyl esterase/lipase
MIAPSLFDPASVSAETRAFNEKLEAQLAEWPSLTAFEPWQIRAAREQGDSLWGPLERLPHAETRTIEGPAGPIPLRILRPDGARGAFLHFHGGGWTLGAEDQHDVMLDALARHARCAVVSVGYRLAPEHPYPAGPDDCEVAALWLARNAAREFGSDRLAIGGESAGAHLSLVTLLRLRDRHGLAPFRGANLVYGAYDLGFTPSVRRWGARNLILSTPVIEWFTSHFVPDPARRADPDVSPLHADLAGLPPALLTVGTLDPLLDDSLFLAARLQAAGVRAELAVAPGGVHGFNAFPLAIAREANRRCMDFVAAALGDTR